MNDSEGWRVVIIDELIIDEFIDNINFQQILLYIKHYFEIEYYFYLK